MKDGLQKQNILGNQSLRSHHSSLVIPSKTESGPKTCPESLHSTRRQKALLKHPWHRVMTRGRKLMRPGLIPEHSGRQNPGSLVLPSVEAEGQTSYVAQRCTTPPNHLVFAVTGVLLLIISSLRCLLYSSVFPRQHCSLIEKGRLHTIIPGVPTQASH